MSGLFLGAIQRNSNTNDRHRRVVVVVCRAVIAGAGILWVIWVILLYSSSTTTLKSLSPPLSFQAKTCEHSKSTLNDIDLGLRPELVVSERCRSLGITPEMISKSRTNIGNVQRWHRLISSIRDSVREENRLSDKPINVTVLGGSVTAGHECRGGENIHMPNLTCAWPHQFETMMASSENNAVITVSNLARGGTPSRAVIPLVSQLTDADVIVIHFTANDDNVQMFYQDQPEQVATAFESLVRTALQLPQQPQVVIFEGLGRRLDRPFAEEMHHSVASVYDIPVISARGAFWFHSKMRTEIEHISKPAHVNHIWHERYACLMYGNWKRESSSFNDKDGNDDGDASTWADVGSSIEPVFGGTTYSCKTAYEASAFSGTLQSAARILNNDEGIEDNGWSYYADVPGKYGYITTSETPGSTIEFTVRPEPGRQNILVVHYLQSYTNDWGNVKIGFSHNAHDTSLLKARVRSVKESQMDEAQYVLRDWERADDNDKPLKVTLTSLGGKFKLLELILLVC